MSSFSSNFAHLKGLNSSGSTPEIVLGIPDSLAASSGGESALTFAGETGVSGGSSAPSATSGSNSALETAPCPTSAGYLSGFLEKLDFLNSRNAKIAAGIAVVAGLGYAGFRYCSSNNITFPSVFYPDNKKGAKKGHGENAAAGK